MTDSSTSRPPLPTSTAGPLSSVAPTGVPVDVPAARWDAILADLATRSVSTEPVLVSSEAITWRDGSLGCGSPGQTYTQALIDGMRVVVTVDGTPYDYRFGAGDTPTLCEKFVPGALRTKGPSSRTA